MKPNGYKEVREAVLIAALSAIATGLIGWGVEEAKKVRHARDQAKKDRKAVKKTRKAHAVETEGKG